METLEARFKRLERSNRWLRRRGWLLLSVGLALALVGQGKPGSRTLEVTGLNLVDETGKFRGGLSVVDGRALLMLTSGDGKTFVGISVGDRIGQLAIVDKERNQQVSLGIEDEWTMLKFEEKGTARLMVGNQAPAKPRIMLFRNEPQAFWATPAPKP